MVLFPITIFSKEENKVQNSGKKKKKKQPKRSRKILPLFGSQTFQNLCNLTYDVETVKYFLF